MSDNGRRQPEGKKKRKKKTLKYLKQTHRKLKQFYSLQLRFSPSQGPRSIMAPYQVQVIKTRITLYFTTSSHLMAISGKLWLPNLAQVVSLQSEGGTITAESCSASSHCESREHSTSKEPHYFKTCRRIKAGLKPS